MLWNVSRTDVVCGTQCIRRRWKPTQRTAMTIMILYGIYTRSIGRQLRVCCGGRVSGYCPQMHRSGGGRKLIDLIQQRQQTKERKKGQLKITAQASETTLRIIGWRGFYSRKKVGRIERTENPDNPPKRGEHAIPGFCHLSAFFFSLSRWKPKSRARCIGTPSGEVEKKKKEKRKRRIIPIQKRYKTKSDIEQI